MTYISQYYMHTSPTPNLTHETVSDCIYCETIGDAKQTSPSGERGMSRMCSFCVSQSTLIWLVVQPINTPQNVTHPRASPIHGNRGMQSKSSQQCEPVHIQPQKMKTHHAKQVVIDKGISLNKSILRVISYDMLYIISYIICMIYCRLYGYRLSCR